MTVLATGVLGLWADSYRTRTLPPLTPEEKAFIDSNFSVCYGLPDPTALIGLDYSHRTDNRVIYRVRTCQGKLWLRSDTGIVQGTPIKRINFSLGDFGMRQGDRRMSSMVWYEGIPAVHDDYRLREVSLPFWALFFLLAMQPVVWFITGPLK